MRSLLLGAASALALAAAPAQAAQWYLGLQLEATTQENTHNDDRYEASAEAIPAGSLFGGRSIAPWLDAEVRLSWRFQRAHGRNGFGGPTNEPGDGKQSVDGHQYAVSALACPRLKTPWDWPVTFYARACAGPAYSWTDTTRTNKTGERHDRAGAALAYEGAVGLERELGAGVSVRLEGGYANADPVEQRFVGVALAYRWGDA